MSLINSKELINLNMVDDGDQQQDDIFLQGSRELKKGITWKDVEKE